MLGVEIWEPKLGEAIVLDQLSPRRRGLAALAIAMALCGAASAALLHAKKAHEHKSLRHYVHCAVDFEKAPCGRDYYVPPRPRGGIPDLLDQPDFPPGP